MVASISATFLVYRATFSALSSLDSVLFSVSMSHQSLCSSSSFCSPMSRKIIFSIIALILSKGPSYVLISWASFWRDFECASRAASRKRFTAFTLGSRTWRKDTAGEVDNFVYEDANDTFIKDEAMQKRLLETNPNAFRDMVTTFLEANGRGYWDTDEENVERLQELYQEVEDRLEGIA